MTVFLPYRHAGLRSGISIVLGESKPRNQERGTALTKDGSMIWDGGRRTALLSENHSGMIGAVVSGVW